MPSPLRASTRPLLPRSRLGSRLLRPLPGPVVGPILRKNTQSAEATALSVAPAKPNDLADGDVIWAALSNGAGPVTITPPSGSWVQVALVNSTFVQLGLFYLPVTNAAGEPATYTWTVSGTAQKLSVSQTGYSGVDPSTIQDVTPATTAIASATSVSAGSLTTVTDGAMLISVAGNDSAAPPQNNLARPGTMSQVFTSTGTGKALQVADETFFAHGATGTRTWTQATSALALGVLLAAMRPATAAAAATTPAPVISTAAVTQASTW